MKATVYYRKDAKPGDLLWVWDSWRPRSRKPGVPFSRGVMILGKVSAINRATVVVSHSRFDIKTGAGRGERGHTALYGWAGGEADLQLYKYVLDRYAIMREVERCSAEQLKRVADMFGYTPEEPQMEAER